MGYLRTIFAIAVVFAHSQYFVFVGGRNAVQLFYMISGFLISYVISTNSTYKEPKKFYINRALRLYPIYYTVAILTLIITFAANPKFFETFRDVPLTVVVFLLFSNLFIFGQDWVMFSGVKDNQHVFTANFNQSDVPLYNGLLVPQGWTLGLELSFYVIAPFILRKNKLVVVLAILSLLIKGFLIAIGIGLNDPWVYRFFPAELSLFLIGAISHQYLLPVWKRFLSSNEFEWIPKLGTFFVIFVSLVYFLIPVSGNFKTLALFFMFFLLLPLTFLFQNNSQSDKAVGELSYPIYIGHILVIMVIGTLASYSNLTNQLFIAFANVIFSIVFAFFLNRYISKRIEKFRAKIKSSKLPRPLQPVDLDSSIGNVLVSQESSIIDDK